MTVKLYHGDCLEVLGRLDAESVHCVVTSPPYWGLRDYGTATWEGGDPECDHLKERQAERAAPFDGGAFSSGDIGYRDVCAKCSARRVDAQLGLEATPEEHVERMVGVFREVRRVLRGNGTLWLNYGDSYAGGGGYAPNAPSNQKRASGDLEAWGKFHPVSIDAMSCRKGTGKVAGLKPKDLVGMPWRVAFALQADGWYLRSDIIWAKPNPMPESVTDRPTKSHEHVFLLAKSQKYFYDADAVREPHAEPDRGHGEKDGGRARSGDGISREAMIVEQRTYNALGRNLRDVWTIATHAYSKAHFATFPPKLVEPCIKAGCPEDGVVLDPFGGAGTVGLVADRLGRDAILIELNEEYATMAKRRIYDDCPMFADVEVVA